MPETKKTTEEPKVKTKAEKDLEKELRASQAELKELKELVSKLLDSKTATSTVIEEEIDINPNKKTKIISLTYGYLSLYAPNRGFLKFDKFGDVKTVTYAQLVDYVNSCRDSAEAGAFYIYNQQMVEDLGLGETYKTLLNEKVYKKILYSTEDFDEDLLRGTTAEQKQVLGQLASEQVYKNEITDMNRIRKISDCIGVDIMDKVKEMQQTEEFIKS